jgi:hypothetical protein
MEKITVAKTRLYLGNRTSLRTTSKLKYIDVLVFDKENINKFKTICDRAILFMLYKGQYNDYFRSYTNRRNLLDYKDKYDNELYIVPILDTKSENIIDNVQHMLLATNKELLEITKKSILKLLDSNEIPISNREIANAKIISDIFWKYRNHIIIDTVKGTMGSAS